MQGLLDVVAQIWRDSGVAGGLRLIGGLAVHLHVGELSRLTNDIDIVAMDNDTREGLLKYLTSAGWRVGVAGGWWRATAPNHPIIDVAKHPIINPRTFDAVALRGSPKPFVLGATEILAASAVDLAILKLLAHRDQDILDLALLTKVLPLDAKAVSRTAEEDDIERRIAEGANVARHAIRSGMLAESWQEAFDEVPVSSTDLAPLDEFLAKLEQEGL